MQPDDTLTDSKPYLFTLNTTKKLDNIIILDNIRMINISPKKKTNIYESESFSEKKVSIGQTNSLK